MLRYSWYRIRFFMQVFQQTGYKRNEYWDWMKQNWDAKVIPSDLGLFNIVLLLMIWFESWVFSQVTATALSLVLFIYGIYWFGTVKRYKPEKEKKPLVFTPRVIRLSGPLFLLAAFIPGSFLYMAYSGVMPFLDLPLPNYYVTFLSFDLLLLVFGWIFGSILYPFWVLPASLITQPVEKSIQDGFKNDARRKLASMPDLKVIALTGSYGKTSTKFMIRDLLKERYNVCSTPGSYNTPMGICKVINNDLNSNHQVLILEMGARYAGNIGELCDIAQPDISVVTNVGFAHLETFGSQDVIAHEKGTLVRRLEKGGVAVLNADDPRVSVMGQDRDDILRIKAGLKDGDIRGSEVQYGPAGMEFRVWTGDEEELFHTKLLGAHNAQNLLLAISVGKHLGLRLKTMALAARRMEPVEHRLEMKQAGDLIVIDDAFNSNPVGAKNAVEILSSFKTGKRIIITPGMVELGEIEYEENRKFGEAIGKAGLDHIYLVGKERSKAILEGIKITNGEADKVEVVESLFEANEKVRAIAHPGDVILYENDLPDLYG
ncbi:UDP-N-acetylmuramoyl-tripeptide--D-alanyl-D-alanine ligase [Balneola sp. MJW-20]|uniref:UDP-N-acetylmuramoyl-tripeptide--D-alanyl-D- alanine ligase n=1 Tax=Gracilimonas aurantiaca TaxID=3234185 RepID=UPI0034663104